MEGKVIPVSAKEKEPIISSIQYPMLTAVNYTVWALRMKVALKAHRVWEAIEVGEADVATDSAATALLFQSIPERLIEELGEQNTAKDMWEAIKSRHVGVERVREARLQTLTSDFELLNMKDSETIDEFAGKISSIASKSASLGQVIEQRRLVKKFLNGLPGMKYIQLVASLEQTLDLNKTGFEDIVGRLKAYEERLNSVSAREDQSRLLFTQQTRANSNYNSNGQRQRADILTKPLARLKFAEMRELIGVQDLSSGLGIKGENVR